MSSETSSPTPPEGWFTLGHHADQPTLVLEFSSETDEGGMPLWERPKPEGEEAEDEVEVTLYVPSGITYSGLPGYNQFSASVTLSGLMEMQAILERGGLVNPANVVNEAEAAVTPVLFMLGSDAAGYARDVVAVLAEKGLLRS